MRGGGRQLEAGAVVGLLQVMEASEACGDSTSPLPLPPFLFLGAFITYFGAWVLQTGPVRDFEAMSF